MDTLGTRLRAERKRQRLTLTALAKRARVGASTLSDLESGRRRSTTKLLQLARALNVSPQWLETGRGPKEPVIPLEQTYIVATSLEDLARQLVDRGNDEITRLWRCILDLKDPH